VIFDTDVLIWASRGYSSAETLVLSEADRAASIVTLMELLRGAKSKVELAVIRQFFVDLEIRIIPLSETISYTAANLIDGHAHADGLRILDALIAATARELGETLATANVRHFRTIPNLSVKAFRPRRM
jgi:predicted nucleic acid-binding protein